MVHIGTPASSGFVISRGNVVAEADRGCAVESGVRLMVRLPRPQRVGGDFGMGSRDGGNGEGRFAGRGAREGLAIERDGGG